MPPRGEETAVFWAPPPPHAAQRARKIGMGMGIGMKCDQGGPSVLEGGGEEKDGGDGMRMGRMGVRMGERRQGLK